MTYTASEGKLGSAFKRIQANKYYSPGLLLLLSAVSLWLSFAPWAQTLLAPVTTFVTAVHEMSHAVVCLATGGSVSGMTIVSDNNGHGGLTFCLGGWPFLYTQAGYLGASFFGCVLIFFGRFQRTAKVILFLLGVTSCLASLSFMFGTVLHGDILQGLGSMVWGLLIGAGLIWGGIKLGHAGANFLLVFLAAQTALNSLTDVIGLMLLSLGVSQTKSFTDATTMAQMTGIPAVVWSGFWALTSVGMLGFTLRICYGPKSKDKLKVKL